MYFMKRVLVLVTVGLFLAALLSTVGCWEPRTYDEYKKVLTDLDSAKGISVPGERAHRLAELSVLQNDMLKDALGARDSITLAMKSAEEVEEPFDRVKLFSWIAECYVNIGRISNARVAMKPAMKASQELPENLRAEEKAIAFLSLASAWSLMADQEQTHAALAVVLETIDKMESDITKIDTLIEVANCYIKVKDDEHRDETFKRLDAMAEANADARVRCDIYCRVATAQFKAGLMEMGQTTLTKAEETIDKIEGEGNQAISMCDVATVYLKYCGKEGKKTAKKLVKKADVRAKKELDAPTQATAQEKIQNLKPKVGLRK